MCMFIFWIWLVVAILFEQLFTLFFMRYLIQRAKSIGHIDTLADFNEKSHDLLTYHPYLSKIKDPVNKQFM